MIATRHLTNHEQEALQKARELAMRLMNSDETFTANDIDRSYQDVLENTSDQIEFQIALGVAIGDLIVSKTDYTWLRVQDDYGEETAIGRHNSKIVCYPISMIQKRLGSKTMINSEQLANDTVKAMEKTRASGLYKSD